MNQPLFWKSLGGTLTKGIYQGDAGLDLTSVRGFVMFPGQSYQVPCGIQIALPENTAALVIGRSSMVKRGLLVFPTLIEQYRGDLFVFCMNLGQAQITINAGDRIAQLLPVPVLATQLDLIQTEDLPASDRGSNGFGSSGK